MKAHLDTDLYLAGLKNTRNMQVHPLNLFIDGARGLCRDKANKEKISSVVRIP